MGVHGLWDEVKKVTPGEILALAKLNAQCMVDKARPLRVAVDTPMALYRYQSSTRPAQTYGGKNHPTRDFFYHVLHILAAGLQPVFVYDGPGKPALKRGRNVGLPAPHAVTNTILGNVTLPNPTLRASSTRTAVEVEREYSLEHIMLLTKRLLDCMGIP